MFIIISFREITRLDVRVLNLTERQRKNSDYLKKERAKIRGESRLS